jgi:hypothetical protein
MAQRRAYINDNELLFFIHDLESWIPDMEAMIKYRSGLTRVFHPYDDLFVTVTDGIQESWPVFQDEEVAYISVLMDHPWIPMGEVIRTKDIPAFMANLSAGTVSLDAFSPQLSYDNGPRLRSVRPPVTPVTPVAPVTPVLPPHVSRILLERAVAEGAECTITGDILTMAATVTSCGHIFDKEAIHTWLSTNNTCPECRTILN